MALITRRSFVRQTAFAAAPCASPLSGLDRWRRELFDPDEQKGAPLDPEAIRKLASHIAGHVITPEDSEYDAVRSIFNLAFNRRPGVIVRCAGPSDVARTVEFAQTKHLPLAVRPGSHSPFGFGMCDGGVAISRVSPTATAFPLREPGYETDLAGVWNALAEKAEVVQWIQATRDSLQPYTHGIT